jgi:RNA polymerase sigma-70 factor (TIGR02943 family)
LKTPEKVKVKVQLETVLRRCNRYKLMFSHSSAEFLTQGSKIIAVSFAHHHAVHCAPHKNSMPPFEQQIAELRSYLLKFATLQLRNVAWAEDAVSETILAALCKPQAFGNRSQLKTWLVGILKHKVIDALRHHRREVCIAEPSDDAQEDPLEYIAFKADGHYAETPADWGNPEERINSKQFFEILEACASQLPPVQGRLFLMREWLELPVEEICKELGLTSTNLYVQLHRARLRLRECLELNWFNQATKP